MLKFIKTIFFSRNFVNKLARASSKYFKVYEGLPQRFGDTKTLPVNHSIAFNEDYKKVFAADHIRNFKTS